MAYESIRQQFETCRRRDGWGAIAGSEHAAMRITGSESDHRHVKRRLRAMQEPRTQATASHSVTAAKHDAGAYCDCLADFGRLASIESAVLLMTGILHGSFPAPPAHFRLPLFKQSWVGDHSPGSFVSRMTIKIQ